MNVRTAGEGDPNELGEVVGRQPEVGLSIERPGPSAHRAGTPNVKLTLARNPTRWAGKSRTRTSESQRRKFGRLKTRKSPTENRRAQFEPSVTRQVRGLGSQGDRNALDGHQASVRPVEPADWARVANTSASKSTVTSPTSARLAPSTAGLGAVRAILRSRRGNESHSEDTKGVRAPSIGRYGHSERFAPAGGNRRGAVDPTDVPGRLVAPRRKSSVVRTERVSTAINDTHGPYLRCSLDDLGARGSVAVPIRRISRPRTGFADGPPSPPG